MRRRSESSRRRGGYTILELMIVLFIVAVVSAVAIPLYQSYQLRSKTAEAKSNLGAIRVLENAHYSEHNEYVAIAPEPVTIPGSVAVDFDASTGFAALGFRPEGRVYFSYGVAVSADDVGYTADAGADIDGDGFIQFWGYAKPDGAGVLPPGSVGCDVSGLDPEQLGPCSPSHGRSVF